MQFAKYYFCKVFLKCYICYFQVVDEVFQQKMMCLHQSIQSPVSVGADGRADSPGHSALYGVTTYMDSKSNLILSSSLVKVSYYYSGWI